MMVLKGYRMRCPSINELPSPPEGKVGWPWTEGCPEIPNNSSWPLLSIVTPSFNQGEFLEETIRSILLQGYPNLEYIIMDGGSSDDSVAIIKKYEQWLSYWISEKDRGQSHAINKGWNRATGEIVAYINSDDYYLPGAFLTAVSALQAEPELSFVYSDGLWVNQRSEKDHVQRSGAMTANQLLTESTPYGIPQPTVFLRHWAIKEVKGLDESLHMAMDSDLWLKLVLRYPFRYLPGAPLATLRAHALQKTQTRVLENLECCLEVYTRVTQDPRYPSTLSRKRNRAIVLLYMLLGQFYIREKHDWATGFGYYMKALTMRPQTVISTNMFQFVHGLYAMLIPVGIRAKIRTRLDIMNSD